MSIHPYIKMSLFLVFALSLSFGGPHQLLSGFILLICGLLIVPQPNVAGLWKMLLRLRWLWLSLIIFYFWLTPGKAVFEEFSKWSPSVEGVYQGMIRVGILASMAMAAHLLFQACSREQLLSSIRWMATPLGIFGLHRDRLAVRMLLVFEAVPEIQTFYEKADKSSNGNVISRIGLVVASIFEQVVRHAESAPLHVVNLESPGSPCLWQWSYPLLLTLMFWGFGFLSYLG